MKKTYVWVCVLALLMFGVGTAAGILSERVSGSTTELGLSTDGDRSSGDASDRRGRRKSSGAPHGRSAGPRLDSIRHLADELSMTDDQRSELDRIMMETTEAIAEHERAIAEEALAARRRVDELLTNEQRDSLDRRMSEMFEKMREQRLAELSAWFEENAQLGGAELERARMIVSEWIESKGEYFRALRRDNGWPEREDQNAALSALSAKRDAALAEFLDASIIESFRKVSDGRDRGSRGMDARGGRERDGRGRGRGRGERK